MPTSAGPPVRCAVCHDPLDALDRRRVPCEQCRRLVHRDCALALGRCPSPGCSGLRSRSASPLVLCGLLGTGLLLLGLTLPPWPGSGPRPATVVLEAAPAEWAPAATDEPSTQGRDDAARERTQITFTPARETGVETWDVVGVDSSGVTIVRTAPGMAPGHPETWAFDLDFRHGAAKHRSTTTLVVGQRTIPCEVVEVDDLSIDVKRLWIAVDPVSRAPTFPGVGRAPGVARGAGAHDPPARPPERGADHIPGVTALAARRSEDPLPDPPPPSRAEPGEGAGESRRRDHGPSARWCQPCIPSGSFTPSAE